MVIEDPGLEERLVVGWHDETGVGGDVRGGVEGGGCLWVGQGFSVHRDHPSSVVCVRGLCVGFCVFVYLCAFVCVCVLVSFF